MDSLDKQLLGRRGGGNPEAPADGGTERQTGAGTDRLCLRTSRALQRRGEAEANLPPRSGS